jgi:myo-inositol-1-phosphate synthase
MTANNSSNERGPKVRVAIVGVGNCSSSLIQGVHFYKDARGEDQIPGLMHHTVGGYHISDIEFVAAFDVDTDKVGKDLSEAIWSGQNNTTRFCEVPKLGVTVQRGHTLDGIGQYLAEVIDEAPAAPVDVAQVLRDTKADVLINFLPVGSEKATCFYMEQALAAGVGVVNCIPVFIARNDEWRARFEKAGVPILGDDIKSQVGATIIHRRLAQLFRDRGIKLERTSQLNVGGNTDFRNMLERTRLASKKESKTNAVTSVLPYELGAENVHVGPSDYVPWLEDRKWAHIRLEGRAFGDVPLNVEVKLEVVDSPNSAGITIDAVRLVRLALDRGVAGALEWPSAYLMKSPPWQHDDDVAREQVEAYIAGTTDRELAGAGV